MAAHESPRTTKLYDRTGDEKLISLNLFLGQTLNFTESESRGVNSSRISFC
jgi:hypothetical protein